MLQIDPVYVLNPATIGVTVESGEPWSVAYTPLAVKAIESMMKNLKIPDSRFKQDWPKDATRVKPGI